MMGRRKVPFSSLLSAFILRSVPLFLASLASRSSAAFHYCSSRSIIRRRPSTATTWPSSTTIHTSGTGSINNPSATTSRPTAAAVGMSSTAPPESPSKPAAPRFVYGKDDALFGAIEKQQGDKPFGSLLDAGTGQHSLRWIATLFARGMTDFTAVTADDTMRANCQREVERLGVTGGTLVKGNWFDAANPLQLEQQYDVILADYLIGAMDGFSPYQQDLMIAKLSTYLKPEGRLYIVGLQPIPDAVPPDCLDRNAVVVCRVRQVRDACILLAGHRCYREYPVEWVHRQIAACSPDLRLLQTKQFPILYRHATIVKQINVGRTKLQFLPVPLQRAMGQTLDDLEAESLRATAAAPTNRIQLGFDYVVAAERTP